MTLLGALQLAMVFCCGSALISEGFVNSAVDSEIFTGIAYLGIICGQLGFGFVVDRYGRKSSMLTASCIMIVGSALCAAAYGAHGSIDGMLDALIADPSGSVACSESTEATGINTRWSHMWFALATDVSIDLGFVIASFVPLVLVWIFGDKNLEPVWRLTFGFGIVPAALVLFWRLRMTREPELYHRSAIKRNIPYRLIIKRYCLGAFTVDCIKPKRQLIIGLVLQGIVGFAMSSAYTQLTGHIAGFAVLYGLFLSMGEFGPGDCLGLLASKCFPTAARGQMYAITAAIGKIGAFAGIWAFPAIIDSFPAGPKQTSGPFWIGSGLAFVSAIVVLLLIKEIKQDGMRQEDEAFRQYLADNGYDVSQMGAPEEVDDESIDEDKKEEMYWKLSDLIICLRRGDQVDEISGFS
ncbi:MFS general substrate transporter [Rhodotorula sp. JG-1b]|nr:MFS general substrate transporter [Rhodotorula sp. JG-1b]